MNTYRATITVRCDSRLRDPAKEALQTAMVHLGCQHAHVEQISRVTVLHLQAENFLAASKLCLTLIDDLLINAQIETFALQLEPMVHA